ncbi:HAD domain-containing protein [Streptomyces purpureus]|uniref:HAD domain-containing protein n=1 Tax=Streptomyces purpureus TaxID=1951 RepID=UPI00167096CB|nr:HAD domain-containing protein [Streptomyces purpureus]
MAVIGSTGRPLLFLDVDGPLIPFGATPQERPGGYPTYRSSTGRASRVDAHPLLSRVNPAYGARLRALPCELVWATTWMDDANACVSPWLGLPELPVVDWPEESGQDRGAAHHRLHWKTRALVERSGGRPFVWVDDEITDADRRWVARHHGGRALLYRVDARQGLTDEDFDALGAWLNNL